MDTVKQSSQVTPLTAGQRTMDINFNVNQREDVKIIKEGFASAYDYLDKQFEIKQKFVSAQRQEWQTQQEQAYSERISSLKDNEEAPKFELGTVPDALQKQLDSVNEFWRVKQEAQKQI